MGYRPTDIQEGYVRDLILEPNPVSPASQVDIGPGLCIDSGNQEVIRNALTLTVDVTVAGVNGLDAGVEAPNTWYFVHLIQNPTTGAVAGLLSTSPTAPVLPPGYTLFRRIGSVRNNAASNFLEFRQNGNANLRSYIYAMSYPNLLLIAGVGGIVGPDLVDVSAFCPVTARRIRLLGVEQSAAGSLGWVTSPGDKPMGVLFIPYINGPDWAFSLEDVRPWPGPAPPPVTQAIWAGGTIPAYELYARGYEEEL